MTVVVTLLLWLIGLIGTFTSSAPSIVRLVTFWIGLSSPLWRCVMYALFAPVVIKRAYGRKAQWSAAD